MEKFQEMVAEINVKQDVSRVRKMLVMMYVTNLTLWYVLNVIFTAG